MLKYLVLLIFLSSCATISDEQIQPLEVFPFFSNHAVLQRDKPFDIWGTATPNENIQLSINQEIFNGKVDDSGAWTVSIAAQEKGGPHIIEINCGEEKLQITDIYFGDVWLCSGQSNMEWEVSNSANPEEEIANGNHPLIRHIKVPHLSTDTPQDTISMGKWESATPETVGNFTAVGYYFAKHIRENHDVPIGLLNSSWGGSRIETWMREEIIDAETKELIDLRIKTLAQENEEIEKKLMDVLSELPKEDKGLVDGKALWADPDFDDSDWQSLSLPSLWEASGYPGLDGIVWFRKEITLSKEALKDGITLRLAKIDDSDMTYLNGQKIGETIGQYNKDRMYKVSGDLLKEGRNVLTIRAEDTGGGGGIYGAEDSLYYESGTEIQTLVGSWKMKIGEVVLSNNGGGLPAHHTPSIVYNSMIHPLINIPIAGVLWYQGESNADTKPEAIKYASQFKSLINDWREIFNDDELPFLFVQLASFGQNSDDDIWPELRAAQTSTLELQNTAQAITMDIGNPADIHPKNKQEVGRRLGLAARNLVYGETDINYQGPTINSVTREQNTLILQFDHFESGLQIRNDSGNTLSGFELTNAENQTINAIAKIVDQSTIEIPLPADKAITIVRYGWKNSDMEANLENSEGLPAVPFSEKIN